jgi:hypothetical protein
MIFKSSLKSVSQYKFKNRKKQMENVDKQCYMCERSLNDALTFQKNLELCYFCHLRHDDSLKLKMKEKKELEKAKKSLQNQIAENEKLNLLLDSKNNDNQQLINWTMTFERALSLLFNEHEKSKMLKLMQSNIDIPLKGEILAAMMKKQFLAMFDIKETSDIPLNDLFFKKN